MGYTKSQIISIITQVANQHGLPPAIALAAAQLESGFNPYAVGDNGSSFGIFQLHRGGELGSHSSDWAYNPTNNANTAISVMASVYHSHPNWTPGQIAAAAQRPADAAGYAAKVNSYYPTYSGGKAVAGGSTTYTASDSALTSEHAQSLSAQDFADQYGFAYGFLKTQPELWGIFQEAVKGGWSTAEFQAKIQGTAWWRAHSDQTRKWDELVKTDPAEASQQRKNAAAHIQQAATAAGASLSSSTLAKLTESYLRFGWTDDLLKQTLGSYVTPKSGGVYGGQAFKDQEAIQQYIGAMGVPWSQKTIGQYVQRIATGADSLEEVTALVKSYAKSMYPSLAPYIDKGMTVKDLADPYIQTMSQTLEMDPASITLRDPWIQKGLQSKDGKGQLTQMPLWQFQEQIRTDPRWDKTQNATDAAFSMVRKIGQDWGMAS